MQDQTPDTVLIQEVLQGRQQSYARLVERYQQYVFTLVLRYIPEREEAEEAAQDVFVKAYKYLADFRGQSKFTTWLYTIVNTTCISRLRRKKDHSLLLGDDHLSAIADRTGGEEHKARMDQQSDAQWIQRAMTRLPEQDVRIITLFYQHEQSLDEIGSIMGMSANNVKVRLFRARQKLKDLLTLQSASMKF